MNSDVSELPTISVALFTSEAICLSIKALPIANVRKKVETHPLPIVVSLSHIKSSPTSLPLGNGLPRERLLVLVPGQLESSVVILNDPKTLKPSTLAREWRNPNF